MNLNQFESKLRNTMQPLEHSDAVSARIDRNLYQLKAKRDARRRWLAVGATAACICAALVGAPSLSAHAALGRVAGAMDNVSHVVLVEYEIHRDGSKSLQSRTSYMNGMWRIERDHGDLSYFFNGTNYTLDHQTGKFVAEYNRKGPFQYNDSKLSLSGLLGDIRTWDPTVSVRTETVERNGQQQTRAIITSRRSPGRTVLFADTATDLPTELELDSEVEGTWIPMTVSVFDYKTPLQKKDFVPDISAHPIIEKSKFEDLVTSEVLKKECGSTPIKRGRVVLRSVDVSQDGTVYVVCQSGEKVAHWDRGYSVRVKDSLGTEYALMNLWPATDEQFIKHSKDGKAELCVFVPVHPQAPFKARTLIVSVKLDASNKLLRLLPGFMATREGKGTSNMWYEDDAVQPREVEIFSKDFSAPSVDAPPAIAQRIAPEPFGDSRRTEAAKLMARADYFRSKKQTLLEKDTLATIVNEYPEAGTGRSKIRLQEIKDHPSH